MHWQSLAFLLIVFIVVAGLAVLLLMVLAPGALRQRVLGVTAAPAPAAPDPLEPAAGDWVERVAKVVQPIGRLSLPAEGWERSPLRTRFMNAGWRQASAPALFFATKTLLALLAPGLMLIYLVGASDGPLPAAALALLSLSAASGYYLPNLVMRRCAARRQREIFENVPDALDLLTVCVEAGLSLERALAKVATEIGIKSATLAQDLQLVLLEMRGGFSKDRALRNLALRSGVEDVDTLVAMLIQSERFGTSMGDALRVHADNLRSKRRLLAEEAAAKISLKLMFPLTFCIFPTLLLVLLGPACIQIAHLLPAMAAGV